MKKEIVAAAFTSLLALSAASTAQAQEVIVRTAPPPPVAETVPPPPPEHRDWAWHPGYHRWDGQRYVWVPGVYEAPPHPHAHWVAGHWVNHGGGWVWRDGHWS